MFWEPWQALKPPIEGDPVLALWVILIEEKDL